MDSIVPFDALTEEDARKIIGVRQDMLNDDIRHIYQNIL